MYVRRLVTAIALLALTACAGLGPLRSEDAETHVTKVAPAEDGPIEQWSAAEWSPDQCGARSIVVSPSTVATDRCLPAPWTQELAFAPLRSDRSSIARSTRDRPTPTTTRTGYARPEGRVKSV